MTTTHEQPATTPFAAQSVATLASTRPASLRALHRHGIDFCCGGGRSVGDACQRAGLTPEQLQAEIAALEVDHGDARRWTEAPLPELIEHILTAHHRPLDEELPRLRAMAAKVLRVHGEKMPETLQGIVDTLWAMEQEIAPHMLKEERVLFPMILAGRGADCGGPVAVMHMEHDALGGLLEQMVGLTEHFTPPAEACNTWRALYVGLGELDADLRLHIHLENNVLFPRALATART